LIYHVIIVATYCEHLLGFASWRLGVLTAFLVDA